MAHVLVVEDDADTRDLLALYLHRDGHQVTFASNGWEALIALDSGNGADLIVLDTMMPGLDGPTFLRIAQRAQQKKHQEMPVIVATALSREDAAERFDGCKIEDIVAKKDEAFFARVVRAVRRAAPN